MVRLESNLAVKGLKNRIFLVSDCSLFHALILSCMEEFCRMLVEHLVMNISNRNILAMLHALINDALSQFSTRR